MSKVLIEISDTDGGDVSVSVSISGFAADSPSVELAAAISAFVDEHTEQAPAGPIAKFRPRIKLPMGMC